MRRAHQITAIVLLLIALLLGLHARELRYYTPLGPGPGFFPVWLCGVLALLAIVVFAQASRSGDARLPPDFFASPPVYTRIVAIVGGLLALALTMPTLGFRLTMLAFCLVLLWLLGRRNPAEIVVLALLGSFGAFQVFVQILNQPLPVGIGGF